MSPGSSARCPRACRARTRRGRSRTRPVRRRRLRTAHRRRRLRRSRRPPCSRLGGTDSGGSSGRTTAATPARSAGGWCPGASGGSPRATAGRARARAGPAFPRLRAAGAAGRGACPAARAGPRRVLAEQLAVVAAGEDDPGSQRERQEPGTGSVLHRGSRCLGLAGRTNRVPRRARLVRFGVSRYLLLMSPCCAC
jgi:hypothetical protein